MGLSSRTLILIFFTMGMMISCRSQDRFTHSGFAQFNIDLSQFSIPPEEILPGGPGKDGIPALTQSKFTSLDGSDYPDDVQGVLIDIGGERKYYPCNILVWHEIANDRVGDRDVAVTFCPLCGSAIVFDRKVDGTTLEFGVSGYLYQSNMLMYDQLTHSFWSQTLGEAVVGELTGSN